MKNPPAKLNAIERAISSFSPKWGFRRLQQKTALALVGGYNGASISRTALRNYSPGGGDANDDSVHDLPVLRDRSRDQVRNSPLAGGAINTIVTNVVGTGLSMQSSIDHEFLGMTEEAADEWKSTTEREYKLWSESKDCDATRGQNFYGLQSLAFRSALESGDVFSLTPNIRRPGKPYGLSLQLIEADRCSNPNRRTDTESIVAGVELDGYGGPLAYHFTNKHPGGMINRKALKWTRIAATGSSTGRLNVIHLFDRRRPGQTRGVPILAPVIEPLKQLSRYTEAELQAAVISGAFSVFVKMDPEAFSELFTDDAAKTYINSGTSWDGSLSTGTMDGPGKVVNLLPGEDISTANPGRPNSEFDPFVQAILRQIGVALELPFEVLIKHFTASYSAARAALLDAWRFFRGRRDWLATNFCQPVYELWLEEAVANGRIYAPGFFADPAIRKAYCGAVWVGDGPGSIDPAKEISAAIDRIESGISTIASESILHDGVDWEIKHRQRTKEQRMRREDGLLPEPAPAPAALVAPPDKQDKTDLETD